MELKSEGALPLGETHDGIAREVISPMHPNRLRLSPRTRASLCSRAMGRLVGGAMFFFVFFLFQVFLHESRLRGIVFFSFFMSRALEVLLCSPFIFLYSAIWEEQRLLYRGSSQGICNLFAMCVLITPGLPPVRRNVRVRAHHAGSTPRPTTCACSTHRVYSPPDEMCVLTTTGLPTPRPTKCVH